MRHPRELEHIRAAGDGDAAFLYDVFCTTWAEEVAALPNPKLAAHVLRIQHTAQEQRFAQRFPGYERFVILYDGQRAGRLYLALTPTRVHALDMTLMPQFRSKGIGSRVITDLLALAADNGQSVSAQIARRNRRASDLYGALGFELVTMDDLDSFLEWRPTVRGARTGDTVEVEPAEA